MQLLADDPLGAARERFEDPLPEGYMLAYEAIQQDPHNDLLVVVEDGVVLGVLQLTLLPNLTYQGSWRAQIEGVRVLPRGPEAKLDLSIGDVLNHLPAAGFTW